jgi:hypothetical protein
MTIAESIKQAENDLLALKDQAIDLQKKFDAAPDDEDLLTALEDVAQKMETCSAKLEKLKRIEASLTTSARPAGTEPGTGGAGIADPPVERALDTPPARGAVRVPGGGAGAAAVARLQQRGLPNPGDYIIRAAIIAGEAHIRGVTPEQVLHERYNDDVNTRAVVGLLVKAAQNPAMTNVPGWAQELTRTGYAQFMEWLAQDSIIPNLPLQRFEFDGYSQITIPMRNPNPTLTNPNLAAGWRKEGAPIRVGAVQLTSAILRPYSCGVIGTFTMELLRRSTPSIETVIRNSMLEDTAIMLDTKFLSADAAVLDLSPAGITNNLGAGNTAASSGSTPAAITADLRARLATMYGKGLGRRPVWVMNPQNSLALEMMITATGVLQFPDMANGQLAGAPVVTSITVPVGVIFLIDCAEIAFAGDAPEFEGTTVATIHEEDSAPLPIVDGAGAVAQPVRSLFQTNSGALRSLWSVDWLRLRDGAVQTITGVAW